MPVFFPDPPATLLNLSWGERMFDGMEWENTIGRVSTDSLQQQLLSVEQEISGLRATELGVLDELDRRQVHTGDGCRTLAQWVSLVLDTTLDDARSLVRTMRRTQSRTDLREGLSDGMSFRRVEALSKIEDDIGLGYEWDVAGVLREAARRVRLTAEGEHRIEQDRFLVIQPSLDESRWKLWGGLDGYSGAIVDKALSDAADALPVPEDMRVDSGWRKATALAQLCMGDAAPASEVSVFVDTGEAAATDGRAGVMLVSGPKLGRQALEAILCDSGVGVFGINGRGEYLRYGRRYRTATPAQTRALLHKYGGRCAADGCSSRNRLQAHHLTPWAQGGETNLEDLILLCWFHHHVVVHQWRYTIYRHAVHGRIRFRRPPSHAP